MSRATDTSNRSTTHIEETIDYLTVKKVLYSRYSSLQQAILHAHVFVS
uniref:Uncharacterized protein n=1 Tax=Anguilla anguilla TaxID=7936 RepID=A0A0E9V509_ANGAN